MYVMKTYQKLLFVMLPKTLIYMLLMIQLRIRTPLNKGILCRHLLTIYAYMKMFTTNIDENERFVVVISLGVD